MRDVILWISSLIALHQNCKLQLYLSQHFKIQETLLDWKRVSLGIYWEDMGIELQLLIKKWRTNLISVTK